jgi:hypothetical protein
MTDVTPPGYAPPMEAGGLFVDPNWTPRLVDRMGSVITDGGGVAEHWGRDLAPVFYPDLPNSFWLEAPVPPLPPTAVTSVVPLTGPVGVATPITITGTGLTGTTDVSFEGSSATNLVVVSDTTVTCSTPAIPNAVPIVMTLVNPNGNIVVGTPFVFAPVVTAVTPSTGSTAGGDLVTITGGNFVNVGTVAFGANAVTPGFKNTTTMEVTSPAGAAGPVDLTLTWFDTSTLVVPNGFTYADPPLDDPVASPQSPDDVQAVAQSIRESAQTIGQAAQDIGEAAQTLSDAPGTAPASGATSEAPNGSTGTTEASDGTEAEGMSAWELDQYWGIETETVPPS